MTATSCCNTTVLQTGTTNQLDGNLRQIMRSEYVQIADRTNTKFIHQRQHSDGWRELSPHGGRTVAYSQLSPGRIAYAIAKVHPNDRYVKETGRTVALAKLNSDQHGIFLGTTEEFFRAMSSATYTYVVTEQAEETRYFTKARV